MGTSTLEPYLVKLRMEFEGFCPTMYRDTAPAKRDKTGKIFPGGNVTIGYGTNLSALVNRHGKAAITSLPFQLPTGPLVSAGAYARASPEAIWGEYERVLSRPIGLNPKKYRIVGSPELAGSYCDELLLRDVRKAENELKLHFPGFSRFPDDAKFALIDMVYNLGMAGFKRYKGLHKAIQTDIPLRPHDPDWMAVASASHRHGPAANRNLWTKRSFERAGWHAPLIFRTNEDLDHEMRTLETHRRQRL